MRYEKGTFKSEVDVKAFVEERLTGFEYVGGYTGCDGRATVKCKKCGTIKDVSMVTVRHSNVRCDTCYQIKAEERIAKENAIKERNKQIKEWNRQQKGNEQINLFDICATCKECGKTFIKKPNSRTYCSDRCRKASINRGKDHRLNKDNIIDKDITLEKLYIKENGTCYICGRKCDIPKGLGGTGNIQADSYPSIEHVKPISKGGLHSWDNVRLACRGCNNAKGNKYEAS